ncbi:TetR family transcriptional regulator C-terminal domain-containing protein [Streptomyces cellulosae]|jgi:AcrR family transcriptional regulator|uniref:TetR/AcrR family transcriptional regulator n=1 Tax=Streptomyces cellulosae TaxID=1968 RepID=UPI002254AF84|nr:TetR family transcriptional regulator C-terminal domain-containing protein [Streptomyces cellulosae]WTB85336.1 TetR family transcriptional regulator C-terminal domain-containing protein [Streptomyces cellulosae]WTC59573.1 TetR family transcriptional regulator C-terminal domain-containing protein [Streptomyces cellulosae]
MPKQVDYGSRRRRIAEAVCLLADEQGPEGVSMRDVAARAQVSLGAVQRCFRTKEEMLLFAVDHVGERVTERVRARIVAGPAQSAATALGHATDEVALLGEEHRAEARIWLAFVAQAAITPSLAEPLRKSYAALQDLFVRLITEAAASNSGGRTPGASTDGPDAVREARTLLALTDGLTGHVLIGHLSEREAEGVLHAHLAGLWARLGVSGPGTEG